MKTPLLLLLTTTLVFGNFSNAQIREDSLNQQQKTMLVIASREDLPRAQEQLDIVDQNEKRLKLANVNVYMVTPKRIESIFQKGQKTNFNLNSYRNWINDDHNFSTVLIDEKGIVKFKSTQPVGIKAIFSVFDQVEQRRPAVKTQRTDTVYDK